MNLLFLVEGGKTEPQVYKSWLSHLFPNLNFIEKPEDVVGDSCRIIAGNGYPNMVSTPKISGSVSRLEACLLDIQNYQNIDYFFICIDSEEESYESRLNEVSSKIESFMDKLSIEKKQKNNFFIIVQHCCFETWALGNKEIPLEYTRKEIATKLPKFQTYYDIFSQDPESMLCCPPNETYTTKAKFHEKYLKEYFKQFGLRYKKKNPGIVISKEYLEALARRCSSTDHLSSLKHLLDILEKIKNTENSK